MKNEFIFFPKEIKFYKKTKFDVMMLQTFTHPFENDESHEYVHILSLDNDKDEEDPWTDLYIREIFRRKREQRAESRKKHLDASIQKCLSGQPKWTKSQKSTSSVEEEQSKKTVLIGQRPCEPHISSPLENDQSIEEDKEENVTTNPYATIRLSKQRIKKKKPKTSTMRPTLLYSKRKSKLFYGSKSMGSLPPLRELEPEKACVFQRKQSDSAQTIPSDGYCIVNYTKREYLYPLEATDTIRYRSVEANKTDLYNGNLTLRRGTDYRLIKDIRTLRRIYVFNPFCMDWKLVLKKFDWKPSDCVWGFTYGDKHAFRFDPKIDIDAKNDFELQKKRRDHVEIAADRKYIVNLECTETRRFIPIFVGDERFEVEDIQKDNMIMMKNNLSASADDIFSRIKIGKNRRDDLEYELDLAQDTVQNESKTITRRRRKKRRSLSLKKLRSRRRRNSKNRQSPPTIIKPYEANIIY